MIVHYQMSWNPSQPWLAISLERQSVQTIMVRGFREGPDVRGPLSRSNIAISLRDVVQTNGSYQWETAVGRNGKSVTSGTGQLPPRVL